MFTAQSGDVAYLRRLLLTILTLATAVAIWLLADLLLLLFAAILLAIALRVIADPISHGIGIGEGWALLIGGLMIVVVLGITSYLFGSQLVHEWQGLADRLPRALSQMSTWLQLGSLQDIVQQNGAASAMGSVLSRALSWGTTVIGAVASLAVVVFGGIYLALDPQLYRAGFMKLVPVQVQANVDTALDECGIALRRWLGAQIVAMAIVGLVTAVGLSLVGLPSALALGLIAGVAEVVPYIGPIAAAIPALAIAFSQDLQTVGWTLAVLVAVQQLENNILMPLLASRSVAIPPALAMFAIVAMGILLGPLGLLLGFPLSIALYMIVKRLYVHDTLGKPVESVTGATEPAAAK